MTGSSRLRAQRAVGSNDVGLICGKGSLNGCHAGREIALRIVPRIRPWWNPRRPNCGELQLGGGGPQMVGDVM